MLVEKAIKAALGGNAIIRRKITNPLDFDELVQQGLPSRSALYLQQKLGLPDDEYSSTLGVSIKTLGRYRRTPRPHLDSGVSDRLYRIARLITLAEEVLEDKQAAINWLHRPQMGLNEKTPFELMKSEAGAKEVESLLYRIEYGIYS